MSWLDFEPFSPADNRRGRENTIYHDFLFRGIERHVMAVAYSEVQREDPTGLDMLNLRAGNITIDTQYQI